MLRINVSTLRIIGVGESAEIPGCDEYTCWRMDQTDRENKTQEAIER
jgi:hypothetical protein